MDEHDTAQAGTDETAPIEHELDIAVSRARAWDAYVHGMSEWWHPGWTSFGTGLDRIEVEPHPGGRILEHHRDGDEHVWGEVVDAVPGERFSHTFRLSHGGDATIVTLEFDDLPHGGTRVRFSHSGWNESNAEGRRKHADWPMLLERYRTYAQHV
ncbi:SRPBCC domain-containing protein [Agrococcus sp. ARC_14]|uniref:SRPBCC domain-containing protein n=1 Tax=Agrococcus sp. ARC_14 TaxID=2919927 RepID=UPI001F067D14|nr:SRPBCC domain-containing protein [Agrococcus sp. ARC_14]MCH1882163.1 SRPBCC domain-containing protein [Agrococcus sp. ARC_14]